MSSQNTFSGAKRAVAGTDRRAVLKATGVVLAGSLLATGTAAAKGGDRTSSGAPTSIGGGDAYAYTERTGGRLSAVGIRFDASVFDGLSTDPQTPPSEYHLDLPNGDTGRFESVGLDYNPGGHPPFDLYGHPHFDFHFYMLDEDEVAAIPGGVAEYDIPEALLPANTSPAPVREVVPGMGEHLFSPVSMPQSPGDDGWSVYIWGAYDPDGDGTGQMIFMEPMITNAYFQSLKGDGSGNAEETTDVPMPERFVKAGWYPTEVVVRYHSDDDAFSVALESFEHFRGYGRR